VIERLSDSDSVKTSDATEEISSVISSAIFSVISSVISSAIFSVITSTISSVIVLTSFDPSVEVSENSVLISVKILQIQ